MFLFVLRADSLHHDPARPNQSGSANFAAFILVHTRDWKNESESKARASHSADDGEYHSHRMDLPRIVWEGGYHVPPDTELQTEVVDNAEGGVK